MTPSAMVKTGTVGAIIAAICCATPILVIGLGAIGLAGVAGRLDWLLIAVLVGCLALVGYGLYRRRCEAAADRADSFASKREKVP